MEPMYVRMLVAIAVICGLLYGAYGGVWGVTVIFLLAGIYIELIAIRDNAALREAQANAMLSIGKAISGPTERAPHHGNDRTSHS